MAYNDKKIISLLMEACRNVDERCPGYVNEITELVAEVINLERQHSLVRINISQKIGDQVNTVGMFLYNKTKK